MRAEVTMVRQVITDLVPPPGQPAAARSFIAPPQGPPPSFKVTTLVPPLRLTFCFQEPIAAESSLLPVVKVSGGKHGG